MSDETRSYCLGNAYFVRAYVYYWIARVWGDAPVILTPTESTGREIYPSRSPRAEVYAQVAQDIESALTHITSNAKGCYYATVDNINMLKADFALWMYAAQKGGDSYLTMAGEALDAVTRTPLLGKFADVFDVKNKANKEIAFALHVDATNEVHSLHPAFHLGLDAGQGLVPQRRGRRAGIEQPVVLLCGRIHRRAEAEQGAEQRPAQRRDLYGAHGRERHVRKGRMAQQVHGRLVFGDAALRR